MSRSEGYGRVKTIVRSSTIYLHVRGTESLAPIIHVGAFRPTGIRCESRESVGEQQKHNMPEKESPKMHISVRWLR